MAELLKPRFHGNGFIQVYMAPDVRLHIWHPEFPATRVENAKIHNHRFDFTSTVLQGNLLDHRYGVTLMDGGPYDLYEIPEASDKSASLVLLCECEVRYKQTRIRRQGSTYTSACAEGEHFHDANGEPGEVTVTLMTKLRTYQQWAQVVCLDKGREPDHAFNNQPRDADMRAVVKDVLRELF